MKTILKKLALMLFVLATVTIAFAQDKKTDKKENEVSFTVNMTCHNCEQKIKKNIAYEKGVKDLTTNLDAKQVVVKYRTDKTDKDKLKKAIEKLGYTCEETTDKVVVTEK